jgi:hypothetical protein
MDCPMEGAPIFCIEKLNYSKNTKNNLNKLKVGFAHVAFVDVDNL